MEVLKIIALLQQLAALRGTVADLVESARETLSSDDEATLKAALADIEAQNNSSFARVREKLVAASQQG